jgi:hypothetical protein
MKIQKREVAKEKERAMPEQTTMLRFHSLGMLGVPPLLKEKVL